MQGGNPGYCAFPQCVGLIVFGLLLSLSSCNPDFSNFGLMGDGLQPTHWTSPNHVSKPNISSFIFLKEIKSKSSLSS